MSTGEFTPIINKFAGNFNHAAYLYVFSDGTVTGRNQVAFVAIAFSKDCVPWSEFTLMPKEEMEVQIALGTLFRAQLSGNELVEVWTRNHISND